MDYFGISFAFIILCSSVSYAQGTRFIHINLNDGGIKEGETLTLDCGDYDNSTKSELVKTGLTFYPWGRKYKEISYDGTWFITRNGYLTEQFLRTGRYEVTRVNGSFHHYQLNIKDAQPEDSGTIGCQITKYMEHNKTVISEINYPYLIFGLPTSTWQDTTTEVPTNISKLKVIEGTPIHIQCLVTFPTSSPIMKIYLIREKKGTRSAIFDDITEKFTKIPEGSSWWSVTNGWLYSQFSTTYKSVAEGLTFNFTHDGAKLSCQSPSNIAGMNTKKDLALDIVYKPYIDCIGSVVNTNGTVTLRCNLYSNTEPNVTWFHTTNRLNKTGFTVSDERNIYQSIITVPETEKDLYNIIVSNEQGVSSSSNTYVTMEAAKNETVVKVVKGLEWSLPKNEEVKARSTLSLECATGDISEGNTLEFIKENAFLRPYYNKEIVVPVKNDEVYVISNNSQITRKLREREQDRYKVTLLDPTTNRYRLDIANVEPGDSGQLGCRMISKDGDIVDQYMRNYTVTGVINSIKWMQKSNLNSQEFDIILQAVPYYKVLSINVTEGQLLNIKCSVQYPTNVPDVSIQIVNPKNYEIIQDVKQYFSPAFETKILSIADGILNSSFEAGFESQENTGFYPTATHNSTHLACKSRDGNGGSWSARILLNVLYAPKIKCTEVQMISETTYRVICEVNSNPKAQVVWTSAKTNQPLVTGDTLKIVNLEREDMSFVSTIVGLKNTDIYTIKAINDMGESSFNTSLSITTTGVLKSVQWTSFGYHEFLDNDDNPLTPPIVTIKEGWALGVKCNIQYTYTIPSVQLLLQHPVSLAILEDVSSYFTLEQDSKIGMSDELSSNVLEMSYVIQGEKGFYPNYTHDGNMLVCKASSENQTSSDKFIIDVQYVPKIECGEERIVLGNTYTVVCKVYSNSKPTIEWLLYNYDKVVTGEKLQITNTWIERENVVESSLTGPHDDRDRYRIQANNELGSTSALVTLQISAADGLMPMTSVLFVTILFYTL